MICVVKNQLHSKEAHIIWKIIYFSYYTSHRIYCCLEYAGSGFGLFYSVVMRYLAVANGMLGLRIDDIKREGSLMDWQAIQQRNREVK